MPYGLNRMNSEFIYYHNSLYFRLPLLKALYWKYAYNSSNYNILLIIIHLNHNIHSLLTIHRVILLQEFYNYKIYYITLLYKFIKFKFIIYSFKINDLSLVMTFWCAAIEYKFFLKQKKQRFWRQYRHKQNYPSNSFAGIPYPL